MTGINCSSDCIYQKDGKCNFENVTATKLSQSSECIYYSQRVAAKCTDRIKHK